MWKVDANFVDGGVNGAGWLTRAIAMVSVWWDKWIIDGLCVNGPALLAKGLSTPIRMIQWGLVQWYALVMVAGVVGIVAAYVVPSQIWQFIRTWWYLELGAIVALVVLAIFISLRSPASSQPSEAKG